MKLLYVTTISDTINAFLVPHIKKLVDSGHQVDIACNVIQEISNELKYLGCVVHNINFQRSPLNKENFQAYKGLKKLVNENNYDVVHTHTPVASVLSRIACKNSTGVKVVYTAHGFHFYKKAPLRNWIFYFPVEYWLSKYTDALVTINNEDFSIAKKFFKANKVYKIPGIGLDTKKFERKVINRSEVVKDIDIPLSAFIVLSVGELNKNKNHEVIINAISQLEDKNIHYIVCGEGPNFKGLVELIKLQGVEKQVHLLGYRTDIMELCNISDVFAFPSLREGLGMAALEAMSTGLPLVTSNVHGIKDYSINNVSGYNCDPFDVQEFKQAIRRLKENYLLRQQMSNHNIQFSKNFSIEKSIEKNFKIYKEIISSSRGD